MSTVTAAQPTQEVKPPYNTLVGYEDLMYYFDFTSKLRKLHRNNISQPTMYQYIQPINNSALELLKFETTVSGQVAHPDLTPATQLLPQQLYIPPFASLHKSDITTQQLQSVLSFKPTTKSLNVAKWVPEQLKLQADASKKTTTQSNNTTTTALPPTAGGRLKKRKQTVDDIIVDIG